MDVIDQTLHGIAQSLRKGLKSPVGERHRLWTLPDLVQAQSRAVPDKLAVVSGEDRLTYGELAGLANRWARALQDAGVERGDPVLVCLGRNRMLPAALLGIMQAGGCYVPVDPDFPADRIAVIVEDAGAEVAVVEQDLRDKLAPAGPITRLSPEVLGPDTGGLPTIDWTSTELAAGDLAYILFTSGSTGRPKGVPISQGALVNFLLAMAHRPGITAEDRVLAQTTVAFDISILELFLPLICGASTWIATKDQSRDPGSLGALIEKQSLTLLQATPSGWRLLLESGWRPNARQRMLCGGEALSIELAETLWGDAGELWNMYGPTEATVWASCHRVGQEDLNAGRIPLGLPIDQVVLELLDEETQLVQGAGEGELLIGGPCLTPGYWQRPELNRERFIKLEPRVPNGEGGIRFYRTGDRVRRDGQGALFFQGRLDDQLKIRGYRVEPGEIETELEQMPAVAEAAVVAIGRNSRRDTLVGCVRSGDGGTADAAQLEARLADQLPGYMIPRVWRFFDDFPRTPNLKTDRRALEKLVAADMTERSATLPEQNFTDEDMARLAAIWTQLLGTAPGSEQDNFLALGGHSLLAAELCARVGESFRRELSLVDVMRHPTLAAQTDLLRAAPRLEPATGTKSIPSTDLQDGIPFSATQRRFWLTAQLTGEPRVFHESEACRLTGPLNEAALETVLTDIAGEPVFRLRLQAGGDSPVWKLVDEAAVDFSTEDLATESELDDRLRDEAQQEFDLERGPTIRFRLYRLTASGDARPRHLLQISAHHLVIDGIAQSLLWQRIARAYRANIQGGAAPEPCGDRFVAYLKSSGNRTEPSSDDFWRAYLRAPLPKLELVTDFPRPARFDFRSHQQVLELPAALLARLKQVAADSRLTPVQILLACFAMTLKRFSGQEEQVVGLALSGRDRNDARDQLGLYINTVALRLKHEPGLRFEEAFRRVSERLLEVLAHGETPFDRIVELARPDRDASRTPIFQALFTHNDFTDRPARLDRDCLIEPVPVDTGYTHTELVLFADQYPDRLALRLQASSQLFAPEQSARILKSVAVLLGKALDDPGAVADQVDLLDQQDRDNLARWNATSRPYPREGSIAGCFLEQALNRPKAVALEQGPTRVTYEALERASAAIRDRLIAAAVSPGDRVAIAAGPSPACIAGILGILRAGAAFVPLDNRYPANRVQLMLEDAGVRLGLATEPEAAKLAGASQWLPLVFDPSTGAEGPDVPRRGGDPAYVMFTSGSTGTPKGIEVCQRNVLRLVKNTDFMTMGTDTRFLMNAPIAFDASTLEIWAPLLNGGTLVIPPSYPLQGGELARLVAEHTVNALWLTAALFHHMAEHHMEGFSGLRYLLAGGDVLSPKWVRAVLNHHPGLTLINGYGPTENTTFTCCHGISRVADERRRIPIGRPIANTRVYILDGSGNACAPGVPGELYAAGDGVALGYVNRPELSGKVFLEDPEAQFPGQRLYRTGDRARWLEEGVVDFLGRIDEQVKIRGFRVEPDEIQVMLEKHPRIDQAVVVAGRQGKEQALLAYVTGDDPDPVELSDYLANRLPTYMIPAAITPMEVLPATPNGKVDRSALPEPAFERERPASQPPQTGTERAVAGIWAAVLRVPGIGREDNFFDLGGTSLAAMEMFVRLEKALGLDLPLSLLYQAPTVGELARYIDEKTLRGITPSKAGANNEQWTTLVPMQKGAGLTPLLFVHAVGGNVLNYRPILGYLEPERPVWGIQSAALDGATNIASSIESMARGYVDAVINQMNPSSVILAGGSMGGAIAVQMAHEFVRHGITVKLVAMFDTFAPALIDQALDEEYRFQGLGALGKQVLKSLSSRARYYGKSLAVTYFRRIRKPIPMSLRPFNIENHNKRIYREFCPKAYHGPVLLVRKPVSDEGAYRSPSLGWGGLLPELRCAYVQGEHEQMIEQPRLAKLFAEAVEGL